MPASEPQPALASTGLSQGSWSELARRWSQVSSPLRPCPEDLQRLQAVWRQSLATPLPSRRLEVLVLGVTQELAAFPWAGEFSLTCTDANEEMIRAVWSGDGPSRRVLRANWLKLPLADASFDLVLSDCGVNVLGNLGQLTSLGREVMRLVRREGRVVMRRYAHPSPAESLHTLIRAIETRTVSSFSEFKLRLLLTLSAEHAAIRVGDAWACFQAHFPDRQNLATQLGCSLDTVNSIDAYQNQDTRYLFPSQFELEQAFAGFTFTRGPAGSYPLAGCCPVFALRACLRSDECRGIRPVDEA
jgi:SAM-dependent methyltransferase